MSRGGRWSNFINHLILRCAGGGRRWSIALRGWSRRCVGRSNKVFDPCNRRRVGSDVVSTPATFTAWKQTTGGTTPIVSTISHDHQMLERRTRQQEMCRTGDRQCWCIVLGRRCGCLRLNPKIHRRLNSWNEKHKNWATAGSSVA